MRSSSGKCILVLRLSGFSKFWRNILIEVVLKLEFCWCILFIVIMSNNNIFWIISTKSGAYRKLRRFFACTLYILWHMSVIDLSDDNTTSTDIWHDKDWIRRGRTYPSKDIPNIALRARLKILQIPLEFRSFIPDSRVYIADFLNVVGL